MNAPIATKVACFNCGSEQTRVFYRIDDIPVHSCLLMPSREAAVGYPRGELQLAVCDTCGVVQIAACDPTV
ncbi:MAG: SAM-dependent methyltransferase, partial [Planctomycetes bacterium]|nr:SAM-dependent methyltransferase [Planctomycetota bacterium]